MDKLFGSEINGSPGGNGVSRLGRSVARVVRAASLFRAARIKADKSRPRGAYACPYGEMSSPRCSRTAERFRDTNRDRPNLSFDETQSLPDTIKKIYIYIYTENKKNKI